MDIDRFSDNHIHTHYCRHAVGEMEEYVRQAIKNGLRVICFLEHMEEGIDHQRQTWLTEKDFDCYCRDVDQLKRQYAEEITIRLGVEVGYNPDCQDELLQRLHAREWDHIGISVHYLKVPERKTHINLFSGRETYLSSLSVNEASLLARQYFATLKQGAEVLPGNSICHIDGALRFFQERDMLHPPWDLIDDLLQSIKHQGLSVEINTSGIRHRGEQYPSSAILRKVLQKRIPVIAGSDAHKPEDVGRYFDQLEDILNNAQA